MDKFDAEAAQKGLTGAKAEQYTINRLADMARTVESTVRHVTPIDGSYVENGIKPTKPVINKGKEITDS